MSRNAANAGDELLTTDEVARVLAIAPRTVRRLVADGQLAAIRIGRQLRFRPADIRAFIAAGSIDPAPHQPTTHPTPPNRIHLA